MRRQEFQPGTEALLDHCGYRVGLGESARHPGKSGGPGKFHQRERIAARLGQDAVPHPLVQRGADRRGQQRARILFAEPLKRTAGQLVQLGQAARLAHREHEGDRLGRDPAGQEGQRLGRRLIQPLCVVDDAQERAFPHGLHQESQRRDADQERIGCAGVEAESDLQRLAVRRGQRRQPVGDGREQLVQRGERQLRLEFRAGRPHDEEPGRGLVQVAQQHALADARLTAQDQGAAPALPRRLKQGIEPSYLVLTADQRIRVCLGHGRKPMRSWALGESEADRRHLSAYRGRSYRR